MDELIKNDNFNEAMFKTKVDNIFVKLHSAFMLDNLDSIKHFFNEEVYTKYKNMIDENNNNNQIRMFDELNVKSTSIQDIQVLEDKYIIKVQIISRYMDYLIDKNSKQYISGINDHRIEKTNILTFEKKKITKEQKLARKCPGCGANIDVNNIGKCSYCGTIYNLDNYDWILTDIITY